MKGFTDKRTMSMMIVAMVLAPGSATPALAQTTHAFQMARLKYDGGGDWYANPQSLPRLLDFVRESTRMDVAPEAEVVEPSSDKLFQFPFLHMTGHGNVVFSEREALRLRRYLLGGGFLHIDDNYGLDRHVRREMRKVFPDQEFVELPFDHPIFSIHFPFANGLPKIHEHDGEPSQGFGLFDDNGRLVVFYSFESDLGDGWEPEEVHNDPPEIRLAALQMGTNIMVYAMTH
jgi:hypothetical protein